MAGAADKTGEVGKAGAPGLTFLVSTNPKDAKSASTKKRVRQAAALKSWRDIKSEIATATPQAALKRRRTGTEAHLHTGTWEGVPSFSIPPPSRPTDLEIASISASTSAQSSASSSLSTHASSSLSSTNAAVFNPHDQSARRALPLPAPQTSKRRHGQITDVENLAVGATACSHGPARPRNSLIRTAGRPAPARARLATTPSIPSLQDLIDNQNAIALHSRALAGIARTRKRYRDDDCTPLPCRAYCNELDPFNCCPVKHRSWYDGVLHHMLTIFAPRAWPALKITNEQGLQWEHFMTQHALAEPALYYVRLLFAVGDMIALDVANPQMKLWLQSSAIEAINEALTDPARATSDALILAIGRIALNESLYGDKVAAHTLHRPAQARMILIRGGMKALHFPPLVKRLMRWSDKIMSMQGGTSRMIPDDDEPHYTDAASVDVLEKWAPREALALRKKHKPLPQSQH